MRILGVLQRFAIVYGFVAIIEVLCSNSKQYSVKTENTSSEQEEAKKKKKVRNIFSDITNFRLQWFIMLCLITIWVLVVYLVGFEGCPPGYLGPGNTRKR